MRIAYLLDQTDHRFDVLCARLQLLGFPVQLIGVAALPYFYVKYAVEGDSIVDDLGAAAVRSCQKYHRIFWSSRPMCNSLLHAVCLYMHLDGASISARVELLLNDSSFFWHCRKR